MHVHVHQNVYMRTTIELSEEQRAALVHLAAKRGLKGFSQIVQEALARFLEEQASRQDVIDAAMALRGSLEGSPGEELSETVEQIRSHWR
jgi:predicted transcriptional regulator